MYLANQNENTFGSLYIALLDNYLNDNNLKSKLIFETILKDAIRLANNQISYFEVDNEYYPIISCLFEKYREYYNKLDFNKIDRNIFIDLRKQIKELETSCTAE